MAQAAADADDGKSESAVSGKAHGWLLAGIDGSDCTRGAWKCVLGSPRCVENLIRCRRRSCNILNLRCCPVPGGQVTTLLLTWDLPNIQSRNSFFQYLMCFGNETKKYEKRLRLTKKATNTLSHRTKFQYQVQFTASSRTTQARCISRFDSGQHFPVSKTGYLR